MLVFYGVGVTVGAGIFALIGQIVGLAGDYAPQAFVLAGLIAATSAVSYALLSSVYPRAAGVVVYVGAGFGGFAARLAGYGVILTAIISSAVIAQAFSGYVAAFLPIPKPVLIVGMLVLLSVVAWLGVRESVGFAALITLLEVGTLVVIVAFGVPLLIDPETISTALMPPGTALGWSTVLSASVIAFFAFIGFEDIVNMAEETVDPERVLPWAIVLTLGITIVVYWMIASVAIAVPDRAGLTGSEAPLAALFEAVTGRSGNAVAAMAAVAMINGVLVQIVMASRVIYGMTREGLMPPALGVIGDRRRTPGRAIAAVTLIIGVLALSLPLLSLAQLTSLITLTVFVLVNLALWRIGGQPEASGLLRRWRYWGLLGAALSVGLLASEIWRIGHHTSGA